MSTWGTKRQYFGFGWKGPDAPTTFAALADMPYSLFFDSARPGHPLNRYSFICWSPFETIESKDGHITITNSEQQLSYEGDPFTAVQERLDLWGDGIKLDPQLPSFKGGAAGMFGYDLARDIETLPSIAKEDHAIPDMAIGLYDQVLAFDHETGSARLLTLAPTRKDAQQKKKWLEDRVEAYQEKEFICPALHWNATRGEEEYRNDIRKVIDYIYAGDMFQANLSRRFTASLPDGFDPYGHYRILRNVNPAPFAAYMNLGNVKIACSSPERFLQVKGRQVETRPIKGTRPASVPAAELEASQKDRSENAMIVDLLRNDLSRACEDHSINVSTLCGIETYEGLHHLVSVVQGSLRADNTPLDLLRVCFPGGSITGAPKVRAMEIIDELEPHRRGPYCGSLGYIGFDGMMDTNIVIRSVIYTGNEAQLQTGGGILAISDPQDELRETLTKAEKLFESFVLQTKGVKAA
jgi:para-aminobenzoate synthetase component 1